MYLNDGVSILLALFDGHGLEGEKIVNFCCIFTTKYYRNEKEMINVLFIQSNPSSFLLNLTEKCDTEIRALNSGINTEFSGT